jgi:hypothetical protein
LEQERGARDKNIEKVIGSVTEYGGFQIKNGNSN